MPRDASELARRLAREAEAVCRQYLSNGRREGRYWLVGDVQNTPGRSLFVRLYESPKGPAGKWTDAATAQGTRLFGKYDSVVAFGQKRALVVWKRLILPNGNSIVIENLPATDVAGYAGLEDEVDFHTWQLLKGIGLATLIGVGTQLSLDSDESDLVKALRESVQQTTNRAGQRLIERELDVQPTITVRPGWPLRVIVSKDLVLKPYQDIQTVAKAR